MPLLRPPTLATTIAICFILLTFLCQITVTVKADGVQIRAPMSNDTQIRLVCTPFGTCEPCPEDSLHEPFCQPFGNRRLMHCQNVTSNHIPTQTDKHRQEEIPQRPPLADAKGEALAWGSCGRIVSKERADFYEFVACNVLFAAVAVFVVLARSKRLQVMQARQLAARIGLAGRGTGR